MAGMRSGVLALALLLIVPLARVRAQDEPVAPRPPPMPAPRESGIAHVNGIDLYYAIYGDGPPVLLLHGGLGHGDTWGYQVPLLAQNHMVIVPDARGQGRSTNADGKLSYDLMAADMLALLDRLDLEKVAVVGWSDGGITGIDLAMHHPERVRRLFAFGANTSVAGLRVDEAYNPFMADYGERGAEDYRRLSPTPDGFDALNAAVSEMWAREPNYTAEDLAAIRVPVTIADGAEDEAIRQDHNAEMAAEIPGARLVILPGTGHFAPWESPDAFNAAMMAFLSAPCSQDQAASSNP